MKNLFPLLTLQKRRLRPWNTFHKENLKVVGGTSTISIWGCNQTFHKVESNLLIGGLYQALYLVDIDVVALLAPGKYQVGTC